MLEEIKRFFEKENIKVFGCCTLKQTDKDNILLSREVLDLLNGAIVFGIPLSRFVIENLVDGPDLLYLHHYRQANYTLDRIAFELALFLEEKGFFSIPVPASQIVDWQKQKAMLSHKHFAYLCGLGWHGRNNLIVNPVYRSRLRFATVLTSAKFEYEPGIFDFGCRDCRKCIEMCPAGAISESPELFNHTACFEKIKELTRRKNISQYICGICIKACEHGNNKKTRDR